jgi:polysaccharide export outer membrane protein
MNNYLKLFFFVFLISLFSCRSSKDLIIMKDTTNDDSFKGLPQQTTEHILTAGDILYISIKTMNAEVNAVFNPESNMETSPGQGYQKYTTPSGAYLYGYEIGQDGSIKLPMMGKIQVAGVPITQSEQIVQKKADELINDGIVKVKLLNFKITVTGEVRNPGVYYNYNNSITVIEAMAMANGNTDYATIKKVMVIRPGAGENKSYFLDLSSKNIFASEAFYLQPNDYVVVQPDRHKNFQLNSQAYSLAISSLSLLLAVLGFVIK